MKQSAKNGKLKILAGPDALIRLAVERAPERDVTVGADALRWAGHAGSPGGMVPGDRIESVAQHDAAFVVKLKPSGSGIDTLTFGVPAGNDVGAWVQAVKLAIGKKPATQSQQARAGTRATPPSDSTPTPIHVNYKVGNNTFSKDYALLVIACDPRALDKVCDYSKEETDTFAAFSNFTFHTTLVKVKTPAKPQNHAVIFAPAALGEMNGNVYAYRNESAKQFGLDRANRMKENLVAVYQLSKTALTDQAFKAKLLEQVKHCSWWPFGEIADDKKTIMEEVTTPYFDHFETSGLQKKLPWKILERQVLLST